MWGDFMEFILTCDSVNISELLNEQYMRRIDTSIFWTVWSELELLFVLCTNFNLVRLLDLGNILNVREVCKTSTMSVGFGFG